MAAFCNGESKFPKWWVKIKMKMARCVARATKREKKTEKHCVPTLFVASCFLSGSKDHVECWGALNGAAGCRSVSCDESGFEQEARAEQQWQRWWSPDRWLVGTL